MMFIISFLVLSGIMLGSWTLVSPLMVITTFLGRLLSLLFPYRWGSWGFGQAIGLPVAVWPMDDCDALQMRADEEQPLSISVPPL